MSLSTSGDINAVVERLISFRDQRAWTRFHTIKDLVLSISIEASELVELTQWKSEEELRVASAGSSRADFEDEIADVAIYLLLLCEKLSIDPLGAVSSKIDRNEDRFPVARGGQNAD